MISRNRNESLLGICVVFLNCYSLRFVETDIFRNVLLYEVQVVARRVESPNGHLLAVEIKFAKQLT